MIEISTKRSGHLHIECTSEFSHLDAIVDKTQEFLEGVISNEDLSYQIVLLLTEAVTNAMEHGNGLDSSKYVRVDLEVHAEHVHIRVEDQGKGFDPNDVNNPLAAENLFNDGGRGIFFIEHIADRVWYENGGRCVHIQFNRTS